MSPEVVFKKLYNENIDIWSMGVLLYELLHGRSAFKAKNLNEISMKLRRPIDLLFDGGLSEEAKDLIKGILKNDPSERLSLKQIFEHKWVKKMYVSVDFDNYKHKNITDNLLKPFLKEITKPENQEKNYQNYCKKNKYVSENEERPFQPMAKEKENYKENKTLFSFQALDYGRVSSKVNKALSSFEKENNPNYTKSKIFDLQMKKKSPDRILKSMENLAPAFEIKLRKEKELSTAIPNKKNMHEIK